MVESDKNPRIVYNFNVTSIYWIWGFGFIFGNGLFGGFQAGCRDRICVQGIGIYVIGGEVSRVWDRVYVEGGGCVIRPDGVLQGDLMAGHVGR